MMSNTILILVLLYESLYDIRNQRIKLMPLLMAGITGALICLIFEKSTWVQLAISLLPGCVLLLAGRVTRQSIGYGDGIVIMVVGIFYGLGRTFCALWIALVLAGIVGLVLVFLKKGGRSLRLPLCPFILSGIIISMILGVR